MNDGDVGVIHTTMTTSPGPIPYSRERSIYSNYADYPMLKVRNMVSETDHIDQEVVQLTDRAIVPDKNDMTCPFYNLYSPEEIYIPANMKVQIPTHIALFWNSMGHYIQVLPNKKFMEDELFLEPNFIERNFKKNITIILHNRSSNPCVIRRGAMIAQYTYVKIASVRSKVVEKFTEHEYFRSGDFALNQA